MKISVVLPSHNNPHRCGAILTALDHIASGNHDIHYHVIVDDDDNRNYYGVDHPMFDHPNVIVHVGSHRVSHFARINQIVRDLDADAVTWFTDDVFPLAMHWDALIQVGIEKSQLPAFAWQEVTDPSNVTYPVLSRRWLQALGYMFPEYFPFWFVDTWIMEVYDLTFGQSFPVVKNLPVGGRRGATRHMHDLAFWFDFFDITHGEREQDALRLAEAFNVELPAAQRAAITAAHHERVQRQMETIPDLEKAYGANQEPPTPRYLSLKAAAEQWLNKHRPAFTKEEEARVAAQ